MSSPVQEHSQIETTPERIARLRGNIAVTLPRLDHVDRIAGQLKGAMIASETADIRSAILDGTATTRTALRELAWALEELSARSVVETRPEAKALNDAKREGYYAALVDREEEDFGQKVSARYREMYREEAARRFPSENAHAT